VSAWACPRVHTTPPAVSPAGVGGLPAFPRPFSAEPGILEALLLILTSLLKGLITFLNVLVTWPDVSTTLPDYLATLPFISETLP
jgi:hypothetical protein